MDTMVWVGAADKRSRPVDSARRLHEEDLVANNGAGLEALNSALSQVHRNNWVGNPAYWASGHSQSHHCWDSNFPVEVGKVGNLARAGHDGWAAGNYICQNG